jgi:hypothetical protein
LLKFFHVPTDSDDIDNPERKKKNIQKLAIDNWLSDKQMETLRKSDKETIQKYLNVYNGTRHTDGKVYQMRKAFRTELETIIKTK